MKFRKKPVVIEAIRFTGEITKEFIDFMNPDPRSCEVGELYNWWDIPTLEGTMKAFPGDWIIRGVKGELYPCKPDIFEATYEEVGDDQA